MMRPCQSCFTLRQRVALLEARLIEMASLIRYREAQLEAPRRRRTSSRARYTMRDELNRFV
jgi:hypothetical protein